MKKLIYILSLFILLPVLNAQEVSEFTPDQFDKEKNYGSFNYIQFRYERGANPTNSDYLKNVFEDGYNAFNLRVGTQSTGRQEWQQLHNHPQYGLGVSHFDLGGAAADTTIGSPSSLFFFFGAPIFRIGKFRTNIDTEIGLSYDFKAYDAETNINQDAIGAGTNLHFNIGLMLYYDLSDRLDINIGAGLTHFSNGRMFTPQRGINLMGLSIGAAYHFNPIKNYTKYTDPNYQPPIRPDEYITAELPTFKKHHELQFMAAVGTVQAEPGEAKDAKGVSDTTGQKGPRYGVSSVSVDYAYQLARKFKVVSGFDFFYDGSAEFLYAEKLPEETTFNDKAFYGWHVGFNYLIERFTLLGNVGWYIHKPFEQRGGYYMRVGGRIQLTDNIDAHICLKTRNGGIADWIEWGLAYRLEL